MSKEKFFKQSNAEVQRMREMNMRSSVPQERHKMPPAPSFVRVNGANKRNDRIDKWIQALAIPFVLALITGVLEYNNDRFFIENNQTDYSKCFSTNEDLKMFVAAAHKLGLKVILDLVYFHCGPKAVFLEEHKDFVKCDENGNIVYGEWCFPSLNFDNLALREYLWHNMEYYVKDFDVDGFRCDVAYLCPTDFWEEGRRRIEETKPDIFMLNEGENADALDFAFDANYHYDWMEKSKQVFGGRDWCR